jgi:hypothetical protein
VQLLDDLGAEPRAIFRIVLESGTSPASMRVKAHQIGADLMIQELEARWPQSRRRGRLGTQAEVVVRMLILKHLRLELRRPAVL